MCIYTKDALDLLGFSRASWRPEDWNSKHWCAVGQGLWSLEHEVANLVCSSRFGADSFLGWVSVSQWWWSFLCKYCRGTHAVPASNHSFRLLVWSPTPSFILHSQSQGISIMPFAVPVILPIWGVLHAVGLLFHELFRARLFIPADVYWWTEE